MSKKFIPCYRKNSSDTASGGLPLIIQKEQPVYSSYSGKLVCHGPIPEGTVCDAPPGHPNHGKHYSVVEYIVENSSYIASDRQAATCIAYVNHDKYPINDSDNNNNDRFATSEMPNTNSDGSSNSWRHSGGNFYSSPYYRSNDTYIQRSDNPIRSSGEYDSDNAWDSLSAYVYDITH